MHNIPHNILSYIVLNYNIVIHGENHARLAFNGVTSCTTKRSLSYWIKNSEGELEVVNFLDYKLKSKGQDLIVFR